MQISIRLETFNQYSSLTLFPKSHAQSKGVLIPPAPPYLVMSGPQHSGLCESRSRFHSRYAFRFCQQDPTRLLIAEKEDLNSLLSLGKGDVIFPSHWDIAHL